MAKTAKKLARPYESLSTTERVKADIAAIDRTYKKVSKNKATAIAFLHKAGILTKTGKLAKAYR